MTLSAGFISVEDQACQVILINLLVFSYMFGSGMQTTTTTLIGNQIGKGDASMAIKTFKELALVSFVIFGFLATFMHKYFSEIINMMTDLDEI